METWDEIRALLDLALRELAVGLIGLLGYAITLLLPIARAWLAERITASAMVRLKDRAKEEVAAILDPTKPILSVPQIAAAMLDGMPQAVKNADASEAGVRALLNRTISEVKMATAAAPETLIVNQAPKQ
jgi:hypothetical protein